VIKYLGSKRLLVPKILALVGRESASAPGGVRSVLDLFSGTARVGHALKRAGYQVIANDHNAYAATLARCYIVADAETWSSQAKTLIRELNGLPGREGFFTETYCRKSRFFHPQNGARIDAIREAIASKGLPPELESILLVSLMEAADRVDSTTGVQMAYLKSWAPRAGGDLALRLPELLPCAPSGKGQAMELDALEAARQTPADLVYLDPPYNQHAYLSNYHIWETLVRWDHPEVYGAACKRSDCRVRKSLFNSRPRFADAFRELLRAIRAPLLIVSFSNEGYLSEEEMTGLLMEFSGNADRIETIEQDHPRYVGCRIGIYNPKGEKVGRVGHLRNRECLYVVRRAGVSGADHQRKVARDALAV